MTLIQTGEQLARAAFRSRTLEAAATETADLTFDPFDPQDMTEINQAMRRFGFCKRLRASFPKVHVVVGPWGAPDYEKTDVQLAGLVEAIGWNLAETKNQIIQFAQVETVAVANPEKTPQEGRRPKPSQSLVISKLV